MRVFHVFPGHNPHHVPPMIERMVAIGELLGVDSEHTYFAIMNREDEMTSEESELYESLQLPRERLLFARRRHPLSFLELLLKVGSSDRIVVHGGAPLFLELLLLRPDLWKRTAWILWGSADITMVNRRGPVELRAPGSIVRRISLWIGRAARKAVVPKLGAISARVPGDYDIVRRLCGDCNHVRVMYRVVSSEGLREHVPPEDRPTGNAGDKTRILLGNSAAACNDHVEALNLLAKFRGENIEIFCPLSYGGNDKYKLDVIAEGKRTFRDKFVPIMDVMPREEYARFLSSMGIFVFNHRRQQGLGNLILAILLGKTVYVRHDSPTYDFYGRQIGIHLRDTCRIGGMGFDDFRAPLNEKIRTENRTRFQEADSKEKEVDGWKRLYEMIGVCHAG